MAQLPQIPQRAMKSSVSKLEDVKVTNHDQLLAAVRPFLPDSKSSIREDLVTGFNIVKDRMEAYQRSLASIETAEFGRHPPAPLANPDGTKFWLDQLIERRMGGQRCGMTVRWVLPTATYIFEPYTGKIECLKQQP
jgi:hypothetical protein